MNVADEYGSSTLSAERVFRDTHARVEGEAALEMAAVFESGWRKARGTPFRIPPAASPARVGGARVLVLDSRPGRGAREVSAVLAAVVAAARRRLWITAAYFAPRSRVPGLLGGASSRGVDVRLLLPGRTDVPLVRHSGHGFYTALLERGVRIFEYAAAVLHAKTVVADGIASVVGSSNLDFRSFERNAECNFLVLDQEIGGRMEGQFEEDLARSREILEPEWRNRGWPHRLGDALARRLAPIL